VISCFLCAGPPYQYDGQRTKKARGNRRMSAPEPPCEVADPGREVEGPPEPGRGCPERSARQKKLGHRDPAPTTRRFRIAAQDCGFLPPKLTTPEAKKKNATISPIGRKPYSVRRCQSSGFPSFPRHALASGFDCFVYGGGGALCFQSWCGWTPDAENSAFQQVATARHGIPHDRAQDPNTPARRSRKKENLRGVPAQVPYAGLVLTCEA